MGGGAKQDAAYKYLCEHANRGDFLILRADTEDDYAKKVDEEILTICPLNSAATIVFASREDSDDPKVVEIIEKAEVIFFAGGDQSNYVRFWQDTPGTGCSEPAHRCRKTDRRFKRGPGDSGRVLILVHDRYHSFARRTS